LTLLTTLGDGSAKVIDFSEAKINLNVFLSIEAVRHSLSSSEMNWQVGQIGDKDLIIGLFRETMEFLDGLIC